MLSVSSSVHWDRVGSELWVLVLLLRELKALFRSCCHVIGLFLPLLPDAGERPSKPRETLLILSLRSVETVSVSSSSYTAEFESDELVTSAQTWMIRRRTEQRSFAVTFSVCSVT